MVKAHSYLNKIANYIPGTSKINGAEKIIKLSSNENALECSNKAIDSYKKQEVKYCEVNAVYVFGKDEFCMLDHIIKHTIKVTGNIYE